MRLKHFVWIFSNLTYVKIVYNKNFILNSLMKRWYSSRKWNKIFSNMVANGLINRYEVYLIVIIHHRDLVLYSFLVSRWINLEQTEKTPTGRVFAYNNMVLYLCCSYFLEANIWMTICCCLLKPNFFDSMQWLTYDDTN